jgi:hypothetical protein
MVLKEMKFAHGQETISRYHKNTNKKCTTGKIVEISTKTIYIFFSLFNY